MSRRSFPAGAKPAPLSTRVAFQLAMSSAEPPEGDAWLHEIKHDGHRLAVVLDGRGGLRLLSRNGYDRRGLFDAPFADFARLGRDMVLDGEIAVPDEKGCTHLEDLTDALQNSEPHRLAYFAFDLLHLDGHDLRGCPLIERKTILEEILARAASPRVVYVSHVIGKGAWLFARAREIGCEGIVSKRLSSPYRAGISRVWTKTKVSETATFIIIGYEEPAPGNIEALLVAERRDGRWLTAGRVPFGVSKRLLEILAPLRQGETVKGRVTVAPKIEVKVRYFGRFRNGLIRDGVLLRGRDPTA
jgi:ATP-dependent DNA ligase